MRVVSTSRPSTTAVSEPEEDVLHLAADLGDQVQVAAPVVPTGSVTSTLSLGQPPVELRALELGRTPVDRFLEGHADAVERHAGVAVAHVPQRKLERALAAEVVDAGPLDLLDGHRGGDRSEGLCLQCLRIHWEARVPSRPSCHPGLRQLCLNRCTSDYDAFAAIYDEWSAPMTEDVAFYESLAREVDGPVVELAVGSGRVAVPVAEAIGRAVIGIDASAEMLAGAEPCGARR